MPADPQALKVDERPMSWMLVGAGDYGTELFPNSGPPLGPGEVCEVVPASAVDALREERDALRAEVEGLRADRERWETDGMEAHERMMREVAADAQQYDERNALRQQLDGAEGRIRSAWEEVARLAARVRELEAEEADLRRALAREQEIADEQAGAVFSEAVEKGARQERERMREWGEARRRPMGAYEIVRTAYNMALDDLAAWLGGEPEPSPERNPALAAVLSEEGS